MTNEPRSTQMLGSGVAPPPEEPQSRDVPRAEASVPLAARSTIGAYGIIKVLGEGGMGTVYECHDPALERRVAIKVLKGDLAKDAEMRTRFLREARAMAKVSSPHVVAVHAVGDDEGAPFIVMEKLEGHDLYERLRQTGPLSTQELVSVLRDAIAGLAAAAACGLVHRDVKPANLFIVDGRTKVTDFGLARPADGSASITHAGLIVGTPHYMAPELGRGTPASIASDIYALGATAFELVTGRPPYTGDTPLHALAAHITDPIPRVLDACPHAGKDLADIIERMLAKQPSARFADYETLDAALRSIGTRETSQPVAKLQLTKKLVASGPVPDTHAAPTPQPSNPSLRVSGPQLAIKTKSLAVMLTDIAGYTERTSSQSREESARWLALHDELLLPILRAFGGTLIKNIGDALLVTFTSPTDAVHCGCAIQDRLFQHNLTATANDRIEVRIAVSAGEVRLQRGDIFGEPVNLAARLEGIGERGEVLITDAVYSTMNTAEVSLAPRGVHAFKGIQRPVTVYAATPDPTPGALPFGGHALARAQSVKTPLEDARRRVQTGLVDLSRRASIAAPRIIDAVRRLSPRVKLGAIVVAGALLVGIAITTIVGRPNSRERAADGRAAGDVDGLFDALDAQNANDAKRALASSTDGDVDDELKTLTKKGTWWQRHHALAILEERGQSVDRERFGMQDLEEGSSCARRKMGLMLLKRSGKTERALDAVRDAARRQPDNACMLFDLTGVESAIRARVKESP